MPRTRLLFIFALLGFGLLILACDDFFVDDADLTQISISPTSPSIQAAATQQFVATGTQAGGGTRDVTTTATWSSTNTSVATINSSGLAVGITSGSTTITANQGGVSSSVTLTVNGSVSSLAISPSTATISPAGTQQFTATATSSDSSTHDVTNFVVWTTSQASVATLSETGLATGVAAGSTTIGAQFGSVPAPPATLTVQ